MKKTLASITLGLSISLLMPGMVMAAEASPLGVWHTIDDKSGKPRSVVRITEVNGELQGKIEKIFFEADEAKDPKCTLCTDHRKDQPVIGMVFLNGLKKDGERYTGGQILDPKNGKIYKSRAELIEGGKKMEVRGYVGAPMFGRTQTWVRAE